MRKILSILRIKANLELSYLVEPGVVKIDCWQVLVNTLWVDLDLNLGPGHERLVDSLGKVRICRWSLNLCNRLISIVMFNIDVTLVCKDQETLSVSDYIDAPFLLRLVLK